MVRSPEAFSIVLQTTRVGPARLLHIQHTPVLQIDQQRSQPRPAVGCSDQARRAIDTSSPRHRLVSISDVRSHPATPVRHGGLAMYLDPGSCPTGQDPPRPTRAERAGERGMLPRGLPRGHFSHSPMLNVSARKVSGIYASPEGWWITAVRPHSRHYTRARAAAHICPRHRAQRRTRRVILLARPGA
jgi:hypothetical protein